MGFAIGYATCQFLYSQSVFSVRTYWVLDWVGPEVRVCYWLSYNCCNCCMPYSPWDFVLCLSSREGEPDVVWTSVHNGFFKKEISKVAFFFCQFASNWITNSEDALVWILFLEGFFFSFPASRLKGPQVLLGRIFFVVHLALCPNLEDSNCCENNMETTPERNMNALYIVHQL